MKYLYRNRKTGEVVETTNRVSGCNWEPVEQERLEQDNQTPSQDQEQPKPRRKK